MAAVVELHKVDLVLKGRILVVVIVVGDLVGVLKLVRVRKTTGRDEVAETKALVVKAVSGARRVVDIHDRVGLRRCKEGG